MLPAIATICLFPPHSEQMSIRGTLGTAAINANLKRVEYEIEMLFNSCTVHCPATGAICFN